MKRTNVTNIPLEICRLIDKQNTSHVDCADISCTALIDSPLIRQLRKKYKDSDEIVVDYADDLYKLGGHIVHWLIENLEQNSLKVPTLMAECKGMTISGVTDSVVFHEGLIKDYKYTSIFVVERALKEGFSSWENQLNVYGWLMRQMPEVWAKIVEIKDMRIVAWSRDFGPRHRAEGLHQIETVAMPVWKDQAAVQRYIENRVSLHKMAESVDTPARCSDSEMWVKPEQFAAMKKGAKKALKLCKSWDEAEQYITKEQVPGGYVEQREKEYPRCAGYCEFGRCGKCPYWDKAQCKTW